MDRHLPLQVFGERVALLLESLAAQPGHKKARDEQTYRPPPLHTLRPRTSGTYQICSVRRPRSRSSCRRCWVASMPANSRLVRTPDAAAIESTRVFVVPAKSTRLLKNASSTLPAEGKQNRKMSRWFIFAPSLEKGANPCKDVSS